MPKTKAQKKKYPQYKNVWAPKGKHWCTEHEQFESEENFGKNKHKYRGLNNRCKDGQREYRKRYEAKYGKRNHESKTLRVSPRLHEEIKAFCKTKGLRQYELARAAFAFYFKYCCTYPLCTNPKGARFDRCAEHVNAVVLTEEDEL